MGGGCADRRGFVWLVLLAGLVGCLGFPAFSRALLSISTSISLPASLPPPSLCMLDIIPSSSFCSFPSHFFFSFPARFLGTQAGWFDRFLLSPDDVPARYGGSLVERRLLVCPVFFLTPFLSLSVCKSIDSHLTTQGSMGDDWGGENWSGIVDRELARGGGRRLPATEAGLGWRCPGVSCEAGKH